MSTQSDTSSNSATAPVFLTGAAGHVGANLVRRLLNDGVRVRVLLRHEDNNQALEGLDVERVYGDIRDLDGTRRALHGCQGVYHVAARISTIEGNLAHRREIYECNVIGTRNVLQAAREAEAGRVVVTGSFSAVGYDLDNPSAPAHEGLQFYPMERTMPYERSKSLVEHECWRAAAQGQDVVVATCCAVVGGADFLPSRLGRTLCDYSHGKLRAYIDGGFEFVAARDIVEGHVLCMHKGRSGEKYIFSTEYKTISEIVGLFEEVSGVPRPARRIPSPIMLVFAEIASFYLSRAHPNFPQRFTPGAIRLLRKRLHADTSKARQELGFQPTTIRDAIHDAYAFHYHQRKVITNPKALRPRAVGAETTNGV
ncbi:MAG: NAD-dependent epimerase/dehydratase family protein [Gammaproteobacteria bacterium]|nr:NAD-dependent epimerase/dehydratase family protein [Gammaproteobacteria bacterium]MCY4211841.1 NAD-dependent epimerase/dehydratase family protein [Gammaproteobacteria bacterium]MCY4338714.1 NAD-dependent epimerase/dehydratase family protein [Gammaproteobacteria bacterium]